ncbi:cytochrome c oxidase assembly protein COX11, mitochondrial isoform X2 [Malaclemys terrapin pileata]|uniref:cytochrome c oxidase assembly protein COX11, mitochondrial isoform X2 n=1 Tax=Malaclemys terrapin pileata TaxID=2991368 RepID=UPI0023A7B753|nr:cytochrome c oxidase assembly protein COX11, mitochondrial isoform X2 [Malaclemys terrapin pileata]
MGLCGRGWRCLGVLRLPCVATGSGPRLLRVWAPAAGEPLARGGPSCGRCPRTGAPHSQWAPRGPGSAPRRQAWPGLQQARGVARPNPFPRGQEQEWRRRNRTVLTYIAAAAVGMATGLGGSAVAGHNSDQIEDMEPVKDRIIKVTFNADVHASLHWNFRPQQTEIYVVPGETALAFYKAKNSTDKPVIGISTYNVVPFEAGQYFNKIQCFCFEEQRLNPQEEVDMPVFFFIDPEFAEDPRMASVDLITLSYTFFEAKEGHKLPLPGYQ